MNSILQDNEIWKDIKHYNGLYQVSNLGRVRSCTKLKSQLSSHGTTMNKVYYGKILSATSNGKGYLIVGLRDENRKNHYVHRLVADAFIEDVDGKVINHKDFNIQNNNVSNLEVLTQKDNVIYSSHRMRKQNRSTTYSSSGEKYIYLRRNKYRVMIKQFGVDKSFDFLCDAINFRDEVIESEKEYFTK